MDSHGKTGAKERDRAPDHRDACFIEECSVLRRDLHRHSCQASGSPPVSECPEFRNICKNPRIHTFHLPCHSLGARDANDLCPGDCTGNLYCAIAGDRGDNDHFGKMGMFHYGIHNALCICRTGTIEDIHRGLSSFQ
ncbi:hypothetical protein ASZ90_014813 [hydrocarbon metagenome]|uniref:Uncharacterized protein n=1 Tax=hydrocarbon metagenome TaxID=938273 RepID=A0A0W8F403_9ZZZZ